MTDRTPTTETCPTCWQPVPVPQRGDHDYGIPLRAAETRAGLDVERLMNAVGEWMQFGAGDGTEAAEAGSEHLLRVIAAEYAALTRNAEARAGLVAALEGMVAEAMGVEGLVERAAERAHTLSNMLAALTRSKP
jgi:hypothetical protein